MERLLIKFTKNNEAKFISHLDTMRTIHRAIRRAELPVVYSKGFNPHPSISVASPLSLGIESFAEYVDIDMEEYIKEDIIKDKFNGALPRGIRVLEVIHIKEKMPASMAAVEGADYSLTLDHDLTKEEIEGIIKEILSSEEIMKLKKSKKSGERLVNIRPLIRDIVIKEYDKSSVKLQCLLFSGSRGNLSPEILADVLKEYSKDKMHGYPQIARQELYANKDEQWISLSTYFSRK